MEDISSRLDDTSSRELACSLAPSAKLWAPPEISPLAFLT